MATVNKGSKRQKDEAKVGIVMGSDSDLDVMQEAATILKKFQIPYHMTVASAHRSPQRAGKFAATAPKRGIKVIIAGAGHAAHLAGVVAAHTPLPVLGVPMKAWSLDGLDSLLSTVQMPRGVPVGTLAIGKAGAVNAALLAAQILGNKYPEIKTAFKEDRERRRGEVLAGMDPRS